MLILNTIRTILRQSKVVRAAVGHYRRFYARQFGKRVLLVDPRTFVWGNIQLPEFERECLRQGVNVTYFDPEPMLATKPTPDMFQETFRSVGEYTTLEQLPALYQPALYSACLELQLAKWEFSLKNLQHQQTLAKWCVRAQQIERALRQTIDYFKPDIVLYLQGYLLTSAIARKVAVELGIGTFAFENTFSGQHLVWDSVSGISVNRTLAANYLWRLDQFTDQATVDRWYLAFARQYREKKYHDHISPSSQFTRTTQRKTVLFLGQVYTDSSTFYGLPKQFHSQGEVLQQLRRFCQRNNWYLLVKLHPKETSGKDPLAQPLTHLTWRKAQAAFNAQPEGDGWLVDIDNRFDTISMIKACDVAVTINSQSGIEAAMFNKPVIVCGHSFYSDFDFCARAFNWDSLEALVTNALASVVDESRQLAVRKFLYLYFTHYCIERNPAAFVRAIRQAPYVRQPSLS